MALVTCNQLTQAIANLWTELNNETMWVQGGKLFLRQGDGRVIQADLVPGMAPLFDQLSVCNTWYQGNDLNTSPRRYTSTDTLATCQGLYTVWSNLSDRIDNLPVDVYVNGLHSYNPATKVLTLSMSDETVVDIPITDLFGDVMNSVQGQLRDCAGEALELDAQVLTCADFTEQSDLLLDQIAGILETYQPLLQDKDGSPLAGNTKVYSTAETNSAINAAVTAATAGLQPALRNCAGTPHAVNTAVPTCAEMNSAIASALAGLPAEVHLVSGSYVSASKTLDLVLNNSAHVTVNVQTLIDDAVTAVPHATLTEVVDGSNTKVVDAQVARNRLNIPVFGTGAAANRPSKIAYDGVAIGYGAAAANTVNSFDTVVGANAFATFDASVMTAPQGSNTVIGAEALRNYTNVTSTGVEGGMVAVGFQTGLRVVGGERSVLVGPAAGSGPTSSYATLSDVVLVGSGAGQFGDGSIVTALDARGEVAIGRYAGARMRPATDATKAGVYIGFNAGQTAYAQGAGTDNVYIGAGAGSQSLGGGGVALGAGAYQGGLGYYVTAVGAGAAKNNVSAHSTFLGANSRGTSTVVAVTTTDTTNAIQRDALGDYVTFAPGVLLQGHPYTIRFFTAPGATGNQMSGSYTGIAESATVLRIPLRNVDAPVGAVPYNPAAVQSIQLSQLTYYDNSTAIGYDTVLTASGTVYLGNAAVTAVRSEGVFYSAGSALTSDARLKSAVAPLDMDSAKLFVKGLRFVSYLKHANFIAKRRQIEHHLQFAKDDGNAERVAKLEAELANFNEADAKGEGRGEAGLIAQEVQTLAAQYGFEYVVTEDANGVLSLDYNSIQAIINAVLVDALV